MRIGERTRVAVVSLLLTWLFFLEYIPPTKRVHIWSDIEGYHYPLLSYIHKSVWQGRIPLWDPWIYCGIPFAGNIQAGLFYPPNWLLFLANARMPVHLQNPFALAAGLTNPAGMRFTSLEIFAFLHAWLAFFFGYLWLRERTAHWLPAVTGGMVVGFSGYLLSQMNHLGVACGFAWMPFALWGIEQASRQRDWRPLWKVAAGSALCLFAGYPPTWLAMMIICGLYALALPARVRLLPQVTGALVLSILIGSIQLLPVWEATRLKTPELAFGGELPFGNGIFGSMLLPNFFDQNRTNDGPEVSDGDYLYLGVPALIAIGWLLRRRRFEGAGAALIMAGGVLFVAADPTGLVLRAIEHLPVVPDALRRYNLIAGIPLAAGLLAASALNDMLGSRLSGITPAWAIRLWVMAAAAWSLYLLCLWPPGGPEFRPGFASFVYPAVLTCIAAVGLWFLRRQQAVALVSTVLFLLFFVEYKAFGTNRRFNAVSDNVDSFWRGDARLGGPTLNGMETSVYHELLRHPAYRIAIVEGPHSTDMRHYSLSTLQGFDPFLPDQYKEAVESFVPFTTNRLFDVNPLDEKMLQHFGVRWLILRHESPAEAKLLQQPSFRQMLPASYYSVFEYLKARPVWDFKGDVSLRSWSPERRVFYVRSSEAGRFVMKEQFFPGWKAQIDGVTAPIGRAEKTFQSVSVPAGEHTIEFRYAPLSLFIGAAISAIAIVCCVIAVWPRRATKLIG